MAESYPCPRCGEDVPTHGVFTSQPSAGPKLPPADQQHAACRRCKAQLYRSVSLEDQGWRLDPRSEHPPWEGENVSAGPLTLSMRRADDDAERLVAHLGRALAEEAQVTQPGPVLFEGTQVTVTFIDGRSREAAKQRVLEALNTESSDWPEFLRFG
jgi:hypothetical protein